MNPYRTSLLAFFVFATFFFGKSNSLYRTRSISSNYGLSYNRVKTILRDHVGYIWMGTDYGLNRFDGKDVKKYFSDLNDSHSLLSDNIFFLHEDMDGKLWISTDKGVNRYDRFNDRFIQYELSDKNEPIFTIFETKDEIWFPDSSWKFHIYNKRSENVSERIIKPIFSNPEETLQIVRIEDFDENYLLIGVSLSGLYLFNKVSGELHEFFKFPVKYKVGGIKILDDFIYCEVGCGIYKLSKSGDLIQFFNEINSGLESAIILDMEYHDEDSTLWVGSDGGGIQVFDKNFRLLSSLHEGPNVKDILPDNSIYDITFTQDGMILLGTVRSGGCILYQTDFEQFCYAQKSRFGPSKKTILCFHEDEDDNIWIGTDGGGLNLLDRETLTFEFFTSPGIEKITSIVSFSNDLLLVGSYRKGLFFFNKKTHQFSNAHKHPYFKDVSKMGRHKMFRDSQNNLWISDGILWRINIIDHTVQRFTTANTSQYFQQVPPFFTTAFETKEGKVWFTSVGGLFSYSPKTNELSDLIVLESIPHSYSDFVLSAIEDQEDNIIFGTTKGIYKYNVKTRLVSDYITNPKYKSLMFTLLRLDKNNRLWAGTSEGPLRIENNDSIEKIVSFSSFRNQESVQYTAGSLLESSDGLLYVGNGSGIIRFNPENSGPRGNASQAVITSLSKKTSDNGIISDSTLAVNVFDDYNLVMDYSKGSYQFNFNAFDILFPKSIEYSYTLKNFEKIWHTGKSNSATYTNLKAGDYVFKVKTKNRNGIWNDETTNIHLKILPPWWETYWFKLILLFVVLVISYSILKAFQVRVNLKQELHLKKREKEQLEEINQMKLRFFTNISHELKTPLSLIYSPLEYLVKSGKSEKEFRNMLPFLHRNARRMVHLTDQILEFRKSEMDELKLSVSKRDLVSSCREILGYYDHQLKIDNIHLHFDYPEEPVEVWLDFDKFFKILSNLISNALKYTPINGRISVSVYTEEECACIEVKDSGSGIPQEELESIFKRYYQVGKSFGGSGIGLALAKQLVELHNGNIQVTSATGEGAEFVVSLPLGNKHFAKDDFATEQINLPFHKAQTEIVETDFANHLTKDVSILIVEDECDLREYLKELLGRSYKITVAKNGLEAFEILSDNEHDLVISDVMMPQMDGIEFCKKLKSDILISHIPVIMLTAKSSIRNRIEGFKSGADAYIPKPFDTPLLFSQIESVLSNRQILKDRFWLDLGVKESDLTTSSADDKFLDKAISIIEQNIAKSDFDVATFVKYMGMSRTVVYNKTKSITGKPVKDFVISIRLRKAAYLLKNSDEIISDIADSCGFTEAAYFSTVFKRHFNQSPSEYRKSPHNMESMSQFCPSGVQKEI